MDTAKSTQLFSRAKQLMPGGVNSPVRACRSVGCDPVFIEEANGATVVDADGNRYLDFVCSWGPMILGHSHPDVVAAIQQAATLGTSYGAPTSAELILAEMVVEAVPGIDCVRFVSSGTEATMSAVRLARGFTGRNVVVKFDGCYHGHADSFLVKAGSGLMTLSIPGSPGVPDDIVKNTISIGYNDLATMEKTLTDPALNIACVIVEPVAGNMGCVIPAPGFLERLRELTAQRGIVLIFDEVISGFRLSLGGAQSYFGVTPDITCLGKIIGGGLPVGAYGGRADIMAMIAPDGPVYQAGTLSGNPLAMQAGIATIRRLFEPGFYDGLSEAATGCAEALREVARRAGIAVRINQIGSMMTMFFTDQPVTDFTSAMTADTERYGEYFRLMRSAGIYLAPSQFELLFLSAAHRPEDVQKLVEMTEWSFKKMAK
ncbi:MAG: glutamate-1-semialdehyde 2,1-aminomutase [Desulfofustis sp. PB-SRB1]|jgi:glutamate-1-semialdehyde 2,1-aminomutase|nr:glutamate-1-semialdehyde 2,1-aminomutase [Desulfofustis sp. PB-SRB1]MBM1001149.1 glutamate-1-semialdehyde 2,1-aminomutase [Desulfofustis sp. PB-SRB1]HBH27431.1 glutamate-1-semialdehyde-2,1-aminomutase [Desulfofustis sp.]HBH32818.1 glutamate-1-semialdehyde-2,1-aminomutase [Desulfofustis sp.]